VPNLLIVLIPGRTGIEGVLTLWKRVRYSIAIQDAFLVIAAELESVCAFNPGHIILYIRYSFFHVNLIVIETAGHLDVGISKIAILGIQRGYGIVPGILVVAEIIEVI
jgi:hypothetical protein